jgi:cytochrome c oxidase assembly factor CtaG
MSWHGWSIQPPLAYVVVAAMLYWVGGRRYSRAAQTRQPLRELAFAAGLVTIVLALESPVDIYADELFWVHMFQHVLLLSVAPPLILIGRPWPRMWLGLPVRSRTTIGRTLAKARWTAGLRMLARPWPAWLLFNASFIGWHIPDAYDATLRSSTVHDLEHAMFFFTGLLFWAHVIEPGPLRSRLTWPARIGYVVGAMVVGWMLAVTLVIVPHPIYAPYAALGQRPGGISALTDQQLAAGVMWVPGSLPYALTLFIGVYRWLDPQRGATPRRRALTT